jgi:hypothetical protein
MKQMNDEEAYELLCGAGFTVLEISRLIQLRRDYTASKLEQEKHAPYVSPSEKMSTLKTLFASLRLNINKKHFHLYY